jgi:hypothetical protein
VRNVLGQDDATKLAEIPVGIEPRCVAVHPNSAIDLETNTVLARDIPSGKPPAPGTIEHAVLVGKLAFFTALGIPDNGIFGTPIRDFNPLADRGKASNNAWRACASYHPAGLSDGVTWIFAACPRQLAHADFRHHWALHTRRDHTPDDP